jgi:hypothetical protein
MIAQPELFPPKAPLVSDQEVHLLIKVLSGRDWMRARQIAATPEFIDRFERSKLSNIERKIRAIANKTDGFVISYPGSPGYKLTLECTIGEIQIATAALRHQAGEMTARALKIDRVYYGKKRP